MQGSALFSVLMANYNNGKYIKYAIQSVLRQSYQHIEIVVVDDHSEDDSRDLLNELVSRHENIRVFSNEKNMGCGYTKHKAAVFARGSIMGYLDPDDTLMDSAVEVMVTAHEQNKTASLIGSSHMVCNEYLVPFREAYGACPIPKGENYLTYGKGITAFASFKKEYYDLTGGINEGFRRAVDQDLYYKLEEVGNVLYIPTILYNYRVHSKGISTGQNIAKSRYWLVRAKEAAFRRRADNNSTKNIKRSELKSWWSLFYSTKAGVALGKRKYCAAIYWMGKSLIKSPLDKLVLVKFKSLFIQLRP